jgi:diguanylate cyclase (GGDEF)-like protein/PAS domain S-box-containing protein
VPPEGVPPVKAATGRLAALARRWAYRVSGTAYLPYPPAEIEHELSDLVGQLFDVVRDESAGFDAAAEVGRRLVELRCIGPDSLRASTEMLAKGLLAEPELRNVERLAERVVQAVAALSAGYSEALREDIQEKQEGLSRALLKVDQETRRKQVLTRAQFEEVFAGSASGVVLTELDGRILRVNAAFAKAVDRTPAALTTLTLYDLIHPDDRAAVRHGYRDLLDGQVVRLRLGRRLVGSDGEPAWATFCGSVIRDASGEPRQLITIIDDDTEVSLLQRRLSHQALHDPVTGLPNRQYFRTRLETALRHADPATGITVYHLDLDGFSLIAGGLGYAKGDRMLKRAAAKLSDVVADEAAIVARLGGDEFGILIENRPETPDVVTTVRRINQELSEPDYAVGRGAALSACIGVVDRPAPDSDAEELLRAAEMTLRRAKAAGHRQWQTYDPVRDADDRHRFGLAASMAGAWETGEIAVVYRPVARLADGVAVGVEARLEWNHPTEGVLRHDECVRLAEATGLILPLGSWLIRTACEDVRASTLPVTVGLTPHQAADPDLVGELRLTLAGTGLAPERLRPGFGVDALLAPGGEALENLGVLTEIGLRCEIHGFGTAGEAECLEAATVSTVRVARRLVSAVPSPLLARSVAGLVEVAHLAGAEVVVDGVDTAAQAKWWRHAGANAAVGAYFPDPPANLARLS